ncbi:hypothetical protein GOBAR_DD32104 [Gossypium barbadense]|nr:hypothetical protein GOBAR_DD32104 [Gossypium barbadense]
MDVIKTQQISSRPIEKVIVHPLVLLSIVDNYNRVAKDTRERVIGVLLGTSFKGTVDVSPTAMQITSFEIKFWVLGFYFKDVPFEEDEKDPSIWFLDHNYHESMFSMFKRINAKEHVVGWCSTGPKLRENDQDIHRLFHNYVPNPVLVTIDVQPKELGIPTKAYYDVEEVKENATQKSQKVFVHVPSEIAAHEVEEIYNTNDDMMLWLYICCLSFGSVIALPYSLINKQGLVMKCVPPLAVITPKVLNSQDVNQVQNNALELDCLLTTFHRETHSFEGFGCEVMGDTRLP